MVTSKSLTAFSPGAVVRQLAWEMLIPASLKMWEISARIPGRSFVTTRTETGRLRSPFTSQETSTRRSGSIPRTFSHWTVWTVTPRPRVMKPTMESPGTGLQQRP